MLARARRIAERLSQEIRESAPSALVDFPPDSYLAAMASEERPGGYQHLPAPQVRWCADLIERGGEALLERYQQLLLARLVEGTDERLASMPLPPSVAELVRRYLEKALDDLERPRAGFYRPDNDAFAKQLCVGRLRLLPCGPELVDRLSGVPRGVLLFGGWGQRLRVAYFLAVRSRGRAPFYTLHTDRQLLGRLNARDYGECYQRVADLLRANPSMKGLMGKSWFYDPVLENISPELAFLGAEPVAGGALRFREGPTPSALKAALRFSRVRQELHQSGRYTPTEYWLIWQRNDLLRWVERR